jgi:hypothetical protein
MLCVSSIYPLPIYESLLKLSSSFFAGGVYQNYTAQILIEARDVGLTFVTIENLAT